MCLVEKTAAAKREVKALLKSKSVKDVANFGNGERTAYVTRNVLISSQ